MFALVGSGEYLPPIEPIDRYLLSRTPGEPRVVCLPTAAGSEGQERVAYWSELGVRHFSGLGAQVDALEVVDRPSAQDPDLAQRIQAANFVYLSGGRPDYLLNVLKDSLAWQAILAVHQAGGVVAGCSAGAMVLGGCIPGRLRWLPAFGLLPGTVIMPHYDEFPAWMAHLVRLLASRRQTLLGIEGSTALVVDGDGWQVLGRGGVVVWNARRRQRFTHGQAVEH